MAMADDFISNVSKVQKVGKILSALDIVERFISQLFVRFRQFYSLNHKQL